MSFSTAFAENRLRRIYPGADVEVFKSPVGNFSQVRFTISDRELVMGWRDREQLAREWERKLNPDVRARKHWSLFRKGRR